MNLDRIGSVVVRTNVGRDGTYDLGGSPYRRQSDLRDAFEFELEDEDMERLWEISGRGRRWDYDGEGADERRDEGGEEEYYKDMERNFRQKAGGGGSGLFLP